MARRDIRKTIAIKAAEDASEAWKRHVQGCAACTWAIRDERPKRICDVGWPLASAEARTRVALDQLRERRAVEAAVEQPVLF